jgi:hypothetical protein
MQSNAVNRHVISLIAALVWACAVWDRARHARASR